MSAAHRPVPPVGTGAVPGAVRTAVQSHADPAITRLAAGVAHDVNNVLAAITLRADLALDGLRSGAPIEETVEDLTAVVGAAVRAVELTDALLLVAGRPADPPEELDLRAVVSGLRSRVETAAVGPTTVGPMAVSPMAVDWDLHPVPAVLAPAAAVERVVLALVANALDATGGGTLDPVGSASAATGSPAAAGPAGPAGAAEPAAAAGPAGPAGPAAAGPAGPASPQVVVRVAPSPHPPPAAAAAGPRPAGVLLEVSDRGAGMTPELAARAAQPYVHEGPAAGRGLGLAVALGVVAALDGTLEIESAAGGGTTVRVVLPAVAAAPAPAPAPTPTSTSAPGPAPAPAPASMDTAAQPRRL